MYDGNGWEKYKALVQHQLEEHELQIDAMEARLEDLTSTVDKLPGRIVTAALVVLIGIAADITVKVITDRRQAQTIQVPPEVNRLIQLLEENKSKRGMEVDKREP